MNIYPDNISERTVFKEIVTFFSSCFRMRVPSQPFVCRDAMIGHVKFLWSVGTKKLEQCS